MLHLLTLNWNGKDKLEKLYPSLLNCLSNIDYKWFIKDNASSDGSIEYIKSIDNPNINLIEWKDNKGTFSEGCNILFKEANPKDNDYILLLNNDIIFNDKTSIKKMLHIIENDNRVGVVGAKLNYTGTNKIQHAGVIIDKRYNMLPYHYRPNDIEDDNARKNREFQAITGAVMLTRASIYREANKNNKSGSPGLSEEFIWSFDDIDYNLFVKYNLKNKIVYCGETNISHEESATLKKNQINKLFTQHNVGTFFRKWKGKYIEDHHFYLKDPNYNLYRKSK